MESADHPKQQLPPAGLEDDAQLRRPSILPKACENCRVRKIRCNKIIPCSNCQISNLTCTPPLRRTTAEHRARRVPATHPPAASGHDIEALHERLHRVEAALQQLLVRSTSPNQSPTPTAFKEEVTASPASIAAFQGDSSFDRHSLQAGFSAEEQAQDLLNQGADMELAAALASLKTVLNTRSMASQVDSLRFAPSPHADTAANCLQLPPAAYTANLFRRVKEQTPLILVQVVFKEWGQLESLCQKAYFPTEPLPAASITLLNGILMYMIEEIEGNTTDPDEIAKHKSYGKLCENNFYTGLQQYDTLVTPTLHNVQVLLLGAVRAQECARPSLHITLLSAAARLCHVLGYHRKAALRNMPVHEAESCREAFWTIYSMEQNGTLSFGRPSSYHEDDIDQDLFAPSEDPAVRGWDLMNIEWIEFGTIQGRIYRKLYSVKGLARSVEKRQKIIDDLAKQLDIWYQRFVTIDITGSVQPEALDYVIKTNDFVYYASLTLLYRAEQTDVHGKNTGHSQRCVAAARLALESHIKYFAVCSINDLFRSYYVNWVLLWPACTPLVVVFTSAITSRNHSDLDLLRQVEATFDVIRSHSEVAERLHNVCAAFVRFATAYLASQEKSHPESRRLDLLAMEEMQLPGVHEADMINMDAFLSSCWGEEMQPLNGLMGMDDMRF